MNLKKLNFWALLLVSMLLAMLIASFFFQLIKAAIYLLVILVLTPIIYLVLRRMARPRILTKDQKLNEGQ